VSDRTGATFVDRKEDRRPATDRYIAVAGGDEDRVHPEVLFGHT